MYLHAYRLKIHEDDAFVAVAPCGEQSSSDDESRKKVSWRQKFSVVWFKFAVKLVVSVIFIDKGRVNYHIIYEKTVLFYEVRYA